MTGASPNSLRGIENLRQICEQYLKEQFSLEIIDIYQQPEIASKEKLVALPLLVKKHPFPERRLVGDLSDTSKVLQCLGIAQHAGMNK